MNTLDDWRENPFARPAPNGYPAGYPYVQICTVEDRVRLVASFTADECRRALQVPGLQLTVRNAVLRRMRRLKVV